MLATTAIAQPEEQRFRRITIDDGLSQSTVVTICQDSLGFLWFGTKDGLNRYDGYNFMVYRYSRADSNSIGGNSIRSLVVDRDGNIWAGANNGTLSRYSHKNQHFVNIPLNGLGADKLQLSAIVSLVLDKEGYIWAGTLADGLYRVHPPTGEYTHYVQVPNNNNSLPSNAVMDLLATGDGNLWIGTHESGLCRYNIKDKSFQRYTELEHGLLGDRVYSIYKALDGSLWVGTEMGASVYDAKANRFSPLVINPSGYPKPSVMAFAQTEPTSIWLSVYPQGIVKLNIETREWVQYAANEYNPYSLNLNDVRELFVDKTENLWIGTNGGGINTLPPHQNFSLYKHIPSDPRSLPSNSVRTVLEDREGNLYVGMYGGLMVYNKKDNTYKHYTAAADLKKYLHNTALYTLKEDVDGRIWIGLEGGGVQLFNPETGLFDETYYNDPKDSTSLINDHVLSILVDSKGQVWFGTHAGLSKLNRETKTFTHYLSNRRNFSGPFIRAIAEDKPGYLWIGADAGLFYLETATGKVVNFPAPKKDEAHNQPPLAIYSIYKDAKGVLWIGTQGSGLYKLDYTSIGLTFSKKEFECVCPSKYLALITVYGILEDSKHNLWLSSDNGLYRYSTTDGNWRLFTKTDGLQSNEFNASAYFKAKDGKMYFGGINGLNTFYPDKLKFNTIPPPVVLTDFKVFNKPHTLTHDIALLEEIVLNHNQNYLTFEFAALDYTAPEKNQYAYQLVGFDQDWIYPGSIRQVTYSNLPAGEYVFKVKASNKDGYWNEEGAAIRLIIEPAFYSTWWFRGILIGILALLLYLIFRARLSGYREQQKLLEEQLKTQSQKLQLEKLKTEYAVSQALIEGQNQEQKRISEDLHDGLGQTLTAASLNLMALDTSIKAQQEEKAHEYLVNLQLLLNSAIQEVRNISHNLMPYLLAEEGLQAALDEMCHRAMKSSNLKIILHITGSEERIAESQEINLYRIAQEIISNAQKHSGAQTLFMDYHVEPHMVSLVVEDDGIGFDPAYLQSVRNLGLGIKNIQVRVQLMKGKIDITTKQGKGVKIKIEVPRD